MDPQNVTNLLVNAVNNIDFIPVSFNDPNIQKIFQNIHASTYPFAYVVQLTAAFFYVSLQTGNFLRYIKNFKLKSKKDTSSTDPENEGHAMSDVKFY